MSTNVLQQQLSQMLLLGKDDQDKIIRLLDKLVRDFDIYMVESWRNTSSKKKNALMHEFVEKQCLNVVIHAVQNHRMNVNIQRESDGFTPFQVAQRYEYKEMCDLLLKLGADRRLAAKSRKYTAEKENDKTMNIVWIDLEFTSLEERKILECAVIITDKDLVELARDQWVIHFEQKTLDQLAQWHQDAFKARDEGGNGLFAEVVASELTKEQVEEELLKLLERYCVEKKCPLAGSSIHIDKEALAKEMPKVHDFLHYRVIDVTSFREITKRWAPKTASNFAKQLADNGRQVVSHRAMDDIEWSIEFMKLFRPLLTGQEFENRRRNGPQTHRRGHSASEVSIVGKNKLPMVRHDIDRSKLYPDEKRLLERLDFEQNFDVRSLYLDRKAQQLYDDNPHLREVFVNRKPLEFYDKEFTKESRLLTSLSGRSNYRKKEQVRTTEHWGQRKLLLSEIEFLTNYATHKKFLVVYAGAAPGLHVNYLSLLFPHLEFVLIDANEFAAKETDKIRIRSEDFNFDMAKKFSGSNRDILFICGVRTFRTYNDSEEDARKDIIDQMAWHITLKPHASLLMLRLPRTSGKTRFLKGDIVLEVWAPKQSIECRLVIMKDATMIDYDNMDFESAMFYFHDVTRTMYYPHDLDDEDAEGLDHCYDCRAEIFILERYLRKVQNITDEKELKTSTTKLSREISRKIQDKSRTSIINSMRTLNVIPKKIAREQFF